VKGKRKGEKEERGGSEGKGRRRKVRRGGEEGMAGEGKGP